GGTLEAVMAHGEHLRAELDRLENSETYRKELDKACAKALTDLEAACRELSQKRKKAAKELGTAVQKELDDLALKQAIFQCQLNPLSEPTTTGMDQIVFEWAPNPGEGIQPLKAIA